MITTTIRTSVRMVRNIMIASVMIVVGEVLYPLEFEGGGPVVTGLGEVAS